MTDIEVMGGEAWERHQRLIANREKVQRTFLKIGEDLYWIEENKLFEELGYETFNAYIASPEIDFSRKTTFQLKRVYRILVLEQKVTPGSLLEAGYTKADMISPYVTQEDPDLLLAQASTLARSDLNIWLRERFPPKPPPPLPKGVFNIIYADPPWKYDFSRSNSRKIENKYPTMELEEIKYMKLPRISKDAVLFLWATSPKLREALEVISAWKFTYKTNMVWVKDKIGMGYYARQQHELLLIAGRGNSVVPNEEDRPSSIIEAPRLEHSEKGSCGSKAGEASWHSASKMATGDTSNAQ